MTPLKKTKTIALLLLPLTLGCFALLPKAQAATSPDVITSPDETFPNFNTAAGLEALLNLTTGTSNTAYGARALRANTTGGSNVAIGGFALINNIDGNFNMAVGNNAMFHNTSGSFNMALGQGALSNNTASGNTAIGFQALFSNIQGQENTAVGFQALFSNTTDSSGFSSGQENTAIGLQALFSNTTGSANTAVGIEALQNNTLGDRNTATGASALWKNTTGNDNAAIGVGALLNNTTGFENAATGADALGSNTTGRDNTATGSGALFNNTIGLGNTGTGLFALEKNTTGSFNIALGYFAGFSLTTGSNNIDIGNRGVAGEANTIRIGNAVTTVWSDGLTHPAQTRTFIAGIRGRTTTNANAVPVVIDSAGQLGTASSSARFKKEIEPMDKTSEAILALKPVTFHYKSDHTGTPQFGLIAEEVAKVNPDLIVRDENGEIYTVRYDAVNAMLLNEFLKEHRMVEEQGAIIAKQQKQIEALTAGLQKVSDQLELSKSKPQTVANNQ
jgi:trimeric autotransporter adhesin